MALFESGVTHFRYVLLLLNLVKYLIRSESVSGLSFSNALESNIK